MTTYGKPPWTSHAAYCPCGANGDTLCTSIGRPNRMCCLTDTIIRNGGRIGGKRPQEAVACGTLSCAADQSGAELPAYGSAPAAPCLRIGRLSLGLDPARVLARHGLPAACESVTKIKLMILFLSQSNHPNVLGLIYTTFPQRPTIQERIRTVGETRLTSITIAAARYHSCDAFSTYIRLLPPPTSLRTAWLDVHAVRLPLPFVR